MHKKLGLTTPAPRWPIIKSDMRHCLNWPIFNPNQNHMIFKYFLQSHTLEELSVFTQYLVSLRVFNPEGAGPDTIVVVMTDEGGENHRNMWKSSKYVKIIEICDQIRSYKLYCSFSYCQRRKVLVGDTFNGINLLFDQTIAWQTNQRSYDNT